MSLQGENRIVLNRTFYTEYDDSQTQTKTQMLTQNERNARNKAKIEEDINSKGWNCPTTKPYEPLGELGNIYKGCKLIQQKFQLFNLDVPLTDPKPTCKFLLGKDHLVSFIGEEKHRKKAQNTSVQPQKHKSRNVKEVQVRHSGASGTTLHRWLATVKHNREHGVQRDDGGDWLRTELTDSFIRLQAVKHGQALADLVRPHTPRFYLPPKVALNPREGPSPPPELLRSVGSIRPASPPRPATEAHTAYGNYASPRRSQPQTASGNRDYRCRTASSAKKAISVNEIERAALMSRGKASTPGRASGRDNCSRYASDSRAQGFTASTNLKASKAYVVFAEPNAVPMTDLSLLDSRLRTPYVHLYSLQEIAGRLLTTPYYKEKSQAATEVHFNPTELVEVIETATNKIIQSATTTTTTTTTAKRRKSLNSGARLATCVSQTRKRLGVLTALHERKGLGGREGAQLQEQALYRSHAQVRMQPDDRLNRKQEAKNGRRHEQLKWLWRPETADAAKLDAVTNVAEAWEEFNTKKAAARDRLAAGLDAQCNNRPKTVEYKKRGLRQAGVQRHCKGEISRMRLAAEKEKVAELKDIVQQHATTYYAILKTVLSNGYDVEPYVHYIMDYYKSVIESCHPFTVAHLHTLLQHVADTHTHNLASLK